MESGLEGLPERVERVEQKVDALTVSIAEAFAEQRQYTEFAFARLAERVDARFEQVDARFEQVDARFDAMDARFNRLERKVDRIIDHLTGEKS